MGKTEKGNNGIGKWRRELPLRLIKKERRKRVTSDWDWEWEWERVRITQIIH